MTLAFHLSVPYSHRPTSVSRITLSQNGTRSPLSLRPSNAYGIFKPFIINHFHTIQHEGIDVSRSKSMRSALFRAQRGVGVGSGVSPNRYFKMEWMMIVFPPSSTGSDASSSVHRSARRFFGVSFASSRISATSGQYNH